MITSAPSAVELRTGTAVTHTSPYRLVASLDRATRGQERRLGPLVVGVVEEALAIAVRAPLARTSALVRDQHLVVVGDVALQERRASHGARR